MMDKIPIDRKWTIEKQLSLKEQEKVTFEDGRSTMMTPAKYTPVLTDSRVMLNGDWTVTKWPFDQAEDKLASKNVDDSQWENVAQPGIVFYYDPEQSPADIKNWDRVTLAHIDDDDGAMVRRKMDIPETWKGKKIILRFDAIFPAARIYCEGKLMGEHLSGLTPVEYDVTDLVVPGEEALVSVRLLRKHKYVQMDMPRHALEFTGISQDAYFHAVEQTYVQDYHLISDLDETLSKGTIAGQVEIANLADDAKTACLLVDVKDAAGNVVAHFADESVAVEGKSDVSVPVKIELANPCLWNDEFPNLYQVDIMLTCQGGSTQNISYKTGFRRLDLKDQRPVLNGNPVKFRGVNHLTFHPEFGMYTPKEWLRECLCLMKKANVNAIRTHFLSPTDLCDLCDELGIYLMQELPIDWGHTYVHDPACVGPALARLEGGVRRDRHSPCLMVWSIGNENMPRNMEEYDDFMNHLHLFDEFVKTLDPSRSRMFPPPGPANKIKGIFETRLGDIGDTHYSFNLVREFNETGKFISPKTWDADMDEFTREEALANGWSGVWFSSEYGIMNYQPDLMNAPYASIISDVPENPLSFKNSLQVFTDRLEREWGYMRDDPTCLGGAYFPWLCSGAGNNPWGWVRWGEDADWGVITADLLPKPAFWAMRVLFSPIKFPRKLEWKLGQTEISFELKNGYNSIDLKDCVFRTMSAGGGKWMGQMRQWKDFKIECAPGETTTVTIPIWNKQTVEALEKKLPVVFRCCIIDPKGFRPVTSDVVVVPEEVTDDPVAMPVGPDAILD